LRPLAVLVLLALLALVAAACTKPSAEEPQNFDTSGAFST